MRRRDIFAALSEAVPILEERTFEGNGSVTWQSRPGGKLKEVRILGSCRQMETPTASRPANPQFLQGAFLNLNGESFTVPVLRALPDKSVRDEYDAVSGKVTRRIGVLSCRGDEAWNKAYSFVMYTALKNRKAYGYIFSNFYRTHTSSPDQDGFITTGFGDEFSLYVTDRKNGTSTQAWKSYLQKQNSRKRAVTFWYELDKPEIEELAPIDFKVAEGENVLSQTGGFEMSSIRVKALL